jgi:hypothetical protein
MNTLLAVAIGVNEFEGAALQKADRQRGFRLWWLAAALAGAIDRTVAGSAVGLQRRYRVCSTLPRSINSVLQRSRDSLGVMSRLPPSWRVRGRPVLLHKLTDRALACNS